MSRLTLPLIALAAASIATTGCSKNRDIPTELAPSRMTQIGVNSYLWRAAVDTLSFAPLITIDAVDDAAGGFTLPGHSTDAVSTHGHQAFAQVPL